MRPNLYPLTGDDRRLTYRLCKFWWVWRSLRIPSRFPLGAKKKSKHIRHINVFFFLTALVGQSSQGRIPPVPGTNGTKWQFSCGIKQKTAGLSQRQVPICPDGSRLGRFLFVPDTIPPKRFMFIGFCPSRFLSCS